MNVLVANIFKMFRQEEPEVDFKKFINSFNSLGSKFNFSGGKLGFLLLTGILLIIIFSLNSAKEAKLISRARSCKYWITVSTQAYNQSVGVASALGSIINERSDPIFDSKNISYQPNWI